MLALIILDGWGTSHEREGNAPALARTPTLLHLSKHYLYGHLTASGPAVGLKGVEPASSELGHTTLGAGRVLQDPWQFKKRFQDGALLKSRTLSSALQHVIKNGGQLHLMGLTEPGEAPGQILKSLIEWAGRSKVKATHLHMVLDGHDSGPFEGRRYLKELKRYLDGMAGVHLSSCTGRAHFLNPSGQAGLTRLLVEALTQEKGVRAEDPETYLEGCYRRGLADDEIKPTCLSGTKGEGVRIRESDALILFSPGKTLEVSHLAKALPGKIRIVHLFKDETPLKTGWAFELEPLATNLGELVSEAKLSQIRLAETLKSRQVSFYLNGGRANPYPREDRVFIPSQDHVRHERNPALSAHAVTRAALKAIRLRRYELVVLNYANGDIVGHTGDLKAAIQAVETVDACLAKVLACLSAAGGDVVITSDHGNCECMRTRDGRPFRAHTSNDVPFYIASFRRNLRLQRNQGSLTDIAPTVLELLGMPKPGVMTGSSLI
ncbi:MAG: phosphoglycerate mutase (2,3-diphosphoglycerate-independent) [Candidatus Omnitrophica bacterium]|nr:phosphoglycerate mutase (2,3-diphosphoglycerate-independent) [Candidatus Omnitrophota bacterium]